MKLNIIAGSIIYFAVHETHKYDKYGDERAHKRRNTFYWWAFFLHLASIMDAYVDAYLDRFNEDMRISFDSDGELWTIGLQISL